MMVSLLKALPIILSLCDGQWTHVLFYLHTLTCMMQLLKPDFRDTVKGIHLQMCSGIIELIAGILLTPLNTTKKSEEGGQHRSSGSQALQHGLGNL